MNKPVGANLKSAAELKAAGRRAKARSILLGAAAFSSALPALAQTPEPRFTAPQDTARSVMPEQQHELLRGAFEAAGQNDWATVRSVMNTVNDPVAKKMLMWRLARSDAEMSFQKRASYVSRLTDWPDIDTIRAEAEQVLAEGYGKGLVSPAEVANFFSGQEPQTGEGRAAFAFALFDLNLVEDAQVQLKQAYRERTLLPQTQTKILTQYARYLEPEDHWARADFLLWDTQLGAAREVIPYLAPDKQALAQARLSLAEGASAAPAVPAGLQNNPGLIFQQARARQRAGDESGMVEMLRRIDTVPETETGRAVLWDTRHLMAREMLEQRNYQAAYDLVRNTGSEDAVDRSEAEFLAGWIALRFLNAPDTAAAHFQILTDVVSTPVSLSRGLYWEGRAFEAAGDMEQANQHYREAAKNITAYYGQLAAERLGGEEAVMHLPEDPAITDAARQQFESRELVQAARRFAEIDEDWWFTVFAYHIENRLTDPVQIALLSDLARQYGEPRPALRVAKSARNRHIDLQERAYPLAFTPPQGPQYAEPALALAISRQETEFDPYVVSSANAHGLMQLIPSTAQITAEKHGMEYRYEWLLGRPEYNAQLGSLHLNDLLIRFNGSYIVSMAGYNAGPTRARQWLETYGDPRTGGIDPVDWIELVPFSETRNYIQRVIENLQVYRARLNGNQAPVTITQDLSRGAIPQATLTPASAAID